MTASDPLQTPDWVRRVVEDAPAAEGPAALMELALRLADANVEHGGGPFGAVVADPQGRLVEVGWNAVIPAHDSTAHAEIVAIRRAQKRLRTHDLAGHAMYASCAPCIQCYGAIWWSNLASVHASATREDAEAFGFREGPVDDALWEEARRVKGLRYVPGHLRGERALAPLRRYFQTGGRLY